MDPFPHPAIADSPGKRSSLENFALAVRERAFAVALTGSFLVLGTLGALHHEMSRDELHSWLLARDSANLWNVFQLTRYEAHFVLWRVFLFGITRCTHNLLALQFFNLLLATTTIWIVARFSPFRKLEKCLLSFGYFFLYEFCIIAQDYTMIVLLMFCFCALHRRRAQSSLSLSGVLFLLANTLPYGFLIGLVFSTLLVFDWACNKESPSLRMTPDLRAGALIVLAGLICATLQLLLMKTGPSTSWRHPLTAAGLSDTIINIWRTYIPIPWGFPFWRRLAWGSNVIDPLAVGQSVKVGLSLMLILVSAGLLLKRPPALFLYLVGVVALLTIQFVVNAGALRHKAFLFMLFVASLWVGGDSAERQWSCVPMQRLANFFGRWRNPFVVGLLMIHVVVGVYTFGADWNYAFSASKRTAQYLHDSGLSQWPIVGSRETRVAPLSAYLDKPIYYLQSSRFGTYADHSRPLEELPAQQVVKESLQLARRMRTNVVLVLAYQPLELQDTGAELTSARINVDGIVVSSSAPVHSSCATITMVGRFGCLVDEPYFLYLIQPD